LTDELINALKRGVKITVVSVGPKPKPLYPDFTQYVTSGKLIFINIKRKDSDLYTGFFHDKIYLSENEAYVGGQNQSGSGVIDCGVSVSAETPLYQDILRKTNYLSSQMIIPLTFSYTSKNPWKYQDNEYFITVSPYFPLCSNKQNCTTKGKTFCNISNCLCNNTTSVLKSQEGGCVFPQQQCPIPSQPVGPYPVGTMNKSAGKVSYGWHQIRDIITKAKKFITITNFEWSMYGGQFGPAPGMDWTFADAIQKAVERGVSVNLWLYNSPMSAGAKGNTNANVVSQGPSTFCGYNPMCNLFRCEESASWFETMNKNKNFNMHWWYQRPADPVWNNDCKILHAKINYSDYGLLITSANFTPTYLGTISNTGFAAIFDNHSPPTWIKRALGEQGDSGDFFEILKTQSKTGKSLCDNGPTSNFQTTASDGTNLCQQGTCMGDPTCLSKTTLHECGAPANTCTWDPQPSQHFCTGTCLSLPKEAELSTCGGSSL